MGTFRHIFELFILYFEPDLIGIGLPIAEEPTSPGIRISYQGDSADQEGSVTGEV